MEFSFEPIQLIFVSVFGFAAWFLIKSKASKSVKITVIVILAALVLFSPVRFKQSGYSSVESINGNSIQSVEIPARVTVEQESFADKNKRELQKMKDKSGSLKDEIHN